MTRAMTGAKRDHTPVESALTFVQAASGGACSTDACAAEYPSTCPVTSAGEAGVNEASFGSAPASGNTPAPPADAAGTSTSTTVALQSVTPTACSQNANYDCAAGYIITATGNTATLVSTTNGNCDQGTATISGMRSILGGHSRMADVDSLLASEMAQPAASASTRHLTMTMLAATGLDPLYMVAI